MKRVFLFLIPALVLASTPAEQKIGQARAAIAKDASNAEAFNALALGLARRARETSNVDYYAQAHAALDQALQLKPDNFETQKVRTWVLLGQHEFAKAQVLARKLNKQVPDDVMLYGLLTDACVELGDYEEAEKAAQWMLDLRPGNIPGLTRGAYLRELFGDLDGATDFLVSAFQRTPPEEVEDRAWILVQIGHLKLMKGDPASAERALQQALTIFPDYHYALANLAKVRIAQKRNDEAVDLLRKRYQAASHAENLFDLAEALHKAGKKEEAAAFFAQFEKASLAESQKTDNSNRELITYYIEYAHQPEKALAIAKREVSWRHDSYTLDAYAWALHANGDDAEARKQIDRALSVGMKDPKVLAHAKAIRGGDAATVASR